MSAKLADIAEHVGVSEATVSRVLNDKPGVAEATREAVLTAVDVLGYHRPAKLRRQMVGLIGIIVPELTNPVFPLFAQTIEARLAAEGYTGVICTQAPGGIQEDDFVAMLLERSVAGIIFVNGRHADSQADLERYRRLRDRRLPFVFVGGYREELPVPSISTDEDAAVRLAVNHLTQLGHEAIGLATGQSRYLPSLAKVDAFRRYVDTYGDSRIAQTWFTAEGGELAARQLFEHGVTGVVCGSDIIAIGVMRAAQQLGLEVPRDVSVIGFDGTDISRYTSPGLTTVRQDVSGMSAAAVRALVESVGGPLPSGGNVLFAPELIVRGSTGPATHHA